MWDREDRDADVRNLAEGEKTLEQGHETASTSVVDAEWDEILEMPSRSWWPPVVAVALSGVFAFILLQRWLAAGIFLLLTFAAIGGWHWKEPQEA
jgi:hypothetical protein